MTTKEMSVGHGEDVTWREHACLVVPLKLSKKYCSDGLLLKDATQACWETIQLLVVDFLDARAA